MLFRGGKSAMGFECQRHSLMEMKLKKKEAKVNQESKNGTIVSMSGYKIKIKGSPGVKSPEKFCFIPPGNCDHTSVTHHNKTTGSFFIGAYFGNVNDMGFMYAEKQL